MLSGTTIEDGEEFSHQIRYIVTDLTKEILGVQTVVVWIEDYSDDELVEAEIAFYAQDDAGNVWFFGEHPEEYEDEELIDAPTWIAGVDGAYPGIAMYADPQPDVPAYFQGWGPAVEWSDFAVVEAVGEEICIELGCFPDSITIAESSIDEEGIAQVKSYAPDVGNIEVGFRGDDATQEQLEVIDHSPVSDRGARFVRRLGQSPRGQRLSMSTPTPTGRRRRSNDSGTSPDPASSLSRGRGPGTGRSVGYRSPVIWWRRASIQTWASAHAASASARVAVEP